MKVYALGIALMLAPTALIAMVKSKDIPTANINALIALQMNEPRAFSAALNQNGFDVNHKYGQANGRTLLSMLCTIDSTTPHYETFMRLLTIRDGLDLESTDNDGWTALCLAWFTNNKVALDLLKGLHLQGLRVMLLAMKIRDLVDRGANIDCLIYNGQTPATLEFAELNTKIPIPHKLLTLLALNASIKPFAQAFNQDHGMFDSLCADKDGNTVLRRSIDAALRGGALYDPHALIREPFTSKINARDEGMHMTALMWAAARGDDQLIINLNTCNPDCLLVDIGGDTALHHGVRSGNVRAVEILIKMDPRALLERNKNGRTPGDIAIDSDKSLEMLAMLKAGLLS